MPSTYPVRFPGFVRPEPLQFWRAQSTLGEAEPQALPTEYQANATSGLIPDLAVGSSGPLAPGTTIEIYSLSPGYLGIAGYGWRRTMIAGAAVSENYRGSSR